MRRLAPALLAVCLALGGTAAHAADDPQPYETVRALQTLQDRIAGGDAASQGAHARAVLRAARVFVKVKAEMWADKRNARALVLYLFSGGDAKTIADAVPIGVVAPSIAELYAGALAYGVGDDSTAREKLMGIDAKVQPGGLGGHLALIQATLAANADKSKAIGLLDLARLLEPGSLVEEAALRKEMSLIGATGDLDKFALLTRRYLGAFGRSSYAQNFRELVARTATEIGADDTPGADRRLARLMTGLEPAERRRLYLAIAHAAALAGRMNMATSAGTEARKLSRPGDEDSLRATIYYGAAAIVGDNYDDARHQLTDASIDRLGAGDRALRDSALAVAEVIRLPLQADRATTAQASTAEIVSDAERSLGASDGALKAVQ